MPSALIFGCLKLKMRFCEIPFPKSIIYSDVVLDKLRQTDESFIPISAAESRTLKVADVLCPWVMKFSRPKCTRKYVNKNLETLCRKKI